MSDHAQLTASLGDPEPIVRREALAALMGIPGALDVDRLLDLLRDPDTHVRALAATALGAIRTPGAVNALLAALTDETEWVRASATTSLANIGAIAVKPTLEFLRVTKNPRGSAALHGMSDPAAADALLDGLRDDDADIRRLAAQFIGPFVRDDVRAALLRATDDPDQQVRHYARVALELQDHLRSDTSSTR